jgi:hypothetical protein
LLISGVLGYLFATIHHCCHWYLPTDKNVINHIDQIKSLREKKLIPSLADTPANPCLEALTTISVLWFERLEQGNPVGNSEGRVAVFGDLAHGTGTARVASGFALLTAILICIFCGSLDLSLSNILRYVLMVAFGLMAILLFHDAYRRTGNISLHLYEQILEHALLKERTNAGEVDGKAAGSGLKEWKFRKAASNKDVWPAQNPARATAGAVLPIYLRQQRSDKERMKRRFMQKTSRGYIKMRRPVSWQTMWPFLTNHLSSYNRGGTFSGSFFGDDQ